MPSERTSEAAPVLTQSNTPMDIASVRMLRMALGTALSMWFSQVVNWPMSFVAPVFTMFVLALPLPVFNLKGGIKFIAVLLAAVLAGMALLPFILNQRMVGLLLLTLAMFHSFYFTARGGSAVLGTFVTVGLALTTAVGTVSIDALLGVVNGLGIGAIAGVCFVWIAHAILPDSMARAAPASAPVARPPRAKPDLGFARRGAIRSLVVTMPIILWFLLSGSSASYVPVLIKVASMGQQAGLDQTREAGKSLLLSTLIGGVAAIIAWEVLSIWPSLVMYVLMIALGGLVMGPRIFAGPGMHPAGATWSYGYLTFIVIIAPAVLDGQGGGSADAAFWSRLMMFVWATVYAFAAVYFYDTIWPSGKQHSD